MYEKETFKPKDCDGNIIQRWDTIKAIKNLPIGWTKSKISSGTIIKKVSPCSDHEVGCKINGIGKVVLKTEFFRKKG